MNTKKKIVLSMIVKNEAHVIERCLASMLPLIDTWCIVDTGSTDGTQEKITNFFKSLGIEGKLVQSTWKGFGASRSEALEEARPFGDYTIMIDADEIMEYDANFDPDKFREGLTADRYNVWAFYGGTRYHRPQLTSNKLRFYYRGVLHEYVDCHDECKTQDFAKGILNRPIQDGARSQHPEKYAKDAETFEEALKGNVDEKDLHRYHFYLAQSYRDSQQWEKALAAYTKRADMGGWNEEVFYSLFQIGRIKEILNHPIDDIIKIYFQAYQVNPWRAETLWAASLLCRKFCRFDQAYHFAKHAIKLKMPLGALFIAEPIYEWCALDEFSIAAYWSGRYKESKIAGDRLLAENKFSEDQRKRIEANHKFACDSLLNGEI